MMKLSEKKEKRKPVCEKKKEIGENAANKPKKPLVSDKTQKIFKKNDNKHQLVEFPPLLKKKTFSAVEDGGKMAKITKFFKPILPQKETSDLENSIISGKASKIPFEKTLDAPILTTCQKDRPKILVAKVAKVGFPPKVVM